MKIHLVMPMGGGGTRFQQVGFLMPKPLIELCGHPFFYWAVQSVIRFTPVEDIHFVVLQEHVDNFHIDSEIRKYYPNADICVIPQLLNGAVLTCLEGVKRINDSSPILFNDCDHAFVSHVFYNYCSEAGADKPDGALLTFVSDSPNYSYVRFDGASRVCGTVEKSVVSSEAICGAYYFGNRELFESAAESYLQHCSYKEFFMSGVYNVLCAEGRKIVTFPTDEHISFGTPEEYIAAEKEEKRLQKLIK